MVLSEWESVASVVIVWQEVKFNRNHTMKVSSSSSAGHLERGRVGIMSTRTHRIIDRLRRPC